MVTHYRDVDRNLISEQNYTAYLVSAQVADSLIVNFIDLSLLRG